MNIYTEESEAMQNRTSQKPCYKSHHPESFIPMNNQDLFWTPLILLLPIASTLNLTQQA